WVRPAWFGHGGRLLTAHPVVNVLAHLILGVAVSRLDLAFELLATAVDLRDVVVGEFAPLLLDFTTELLPAAFDAIPIHVQTSCLLRIKTGFHARALSTRPPADAAPVPVLACQRACWRGKRGTTMGAGG